MFCPAVLSKLLLFSCLVPAVPLSDQEKQNRIVAVSRSEASLLSVALSEAAPELLRVALTHAHPRLLETALTQADPQLLAAALNNVDPDLLAVALSRSKPELLKTALTVANKRLLRTAINLPTNPAILAVALTKSDPGLLAVVLHDATVENLIVALTAAGQKHEQTGETSLTKDDYDNKTSDDYDDNTSDDYDDNTSDDDEYESESRFSIPSQADSSVFSYGSSISPAIQPSPGHSLEQESAFPAIPARVSEVPTPANSQVRSVNRSPNLFSYKPKKLRGSSGKILKVSNSSFQTKVTRPSASAALLSYSPAASSHIQAAPVPLTAKQDGWKRIPSRITW